MKFLFSFIIVFCTFGIISCLMYICFQYKIILAEKERLKSTTSTTEFKPVSKDTTEKFIYDNNSDSITIEV